ncbi:MAG: epoxyqueuosine reductase [Clostridia bacterium]|nr:epoxyqueuosine reductase [Clostridia bacterium]
MTVTELLELAARFLEENSLNYLAQEDALRPELAGLRIYDAPIAGVAAADSPLFESFRTPGIVHPEMMLPTDFLPQAKSVISFFVPFTEEVRRSNRTPRERASDEWMHARVEGQNTLSALGKYLTKAMEERGCAAVFPMADPRFHLIEPTVSNWSERHVAYACGLGTFGISRGLITKKGMAGRFFSIITEEELPVTEHDYRDPFAYCILCGACERMCPAGAIDTKRGVIHGKDQMKCKAFLQETTLQPQGSIKRAQYGCGKCQVNVPCEHGIPLK